MAKYPDSHNRYPASPNVYPTAAKAFPGSGANVYPAAASASFDPIVNVAGNVMEIDFNTALPTTSSASVANGSDFTNASWTKLQCTVTGDAEGSADRITVSAAAATPMVTSALTNAQSGSQCVPITFSIKAKYESVQWLVIESRASVAANQSFFDIQNGVVGTSGASHTSAAISAADGSGYRTLTVTCTTNSGTNAWRLLLSSTDAVQTAPTSGNSVLVQEASVTQVRLASATNRKTSAVWNNGTAASQLGYDATGLGGKPCVVSYGQQQLISTEAGVVGALGTDAAHYLVVVCQFTATADQTSALFGAGNSGVATNQTKRWGNVNTAGGRWTSSIIDDAAVTFTVSSGVDIANQTSAKVLEYFGPGTTESVQENGAAADPNASAQDSGTITLNQVAIAARPDSVPDLMPTGCKIGVVALWDNVPSLSDRSSTRVYYANTRGITVTP